MRVPVFIFILFILQASSCVRDAGECGATWYNKTDDRLTIINETSENITISFSQEYPDDSLVLDQYVPNEQKVNANDADNVGANNREKFSIRGCWESRFERIPSGKLRILIFKIDTIKALPASEIINRRLYTSYLFTLEDLRAMNWHVVYQ